LRARTGPIDRQRTCRAAGASPARTLGSRPRVVLRRRGAARAAGVIDSILHRRRRLGHAGSAISAVRQLVPSILGEMLRAPGPLRADRGMKAMLQMIRLDVGALERAYGGGSAAAEFQPTRAPVQA